MQRILFVLAILLVLPGRPQQAQQSQTTQPAQQTGSIEGTVLRFGTTDPIARARVTLRPSNSPNSQVVTADDGGKFTFRDLAPGQYRITVARDGYVAGEYGQRSPSSSGVPISLTAQQQFKDARITLTPSGTISGRIVNRYGEPVGNANVQALRYTYQEGRRSLTPFQSIRTNDLGEYRLFWMQPGQYIVSAQGMDSVVVDPGGTIFFQTARGSGPGALNLGGAQLGVGGVTRITVTGGGPGPGDVFAGAGLPPPPPPPPPPPGVVVDDSNVSLPVYFPGTTDVTAATPIDLRAGGNVGGVNLTVVDAKPVRIKGQVLNGGRPASGAQVSMYQRNNTNGTLTVRGAPVNNDTGAFEFRNVAPGGYELVASLNGSGPGAMIMNTPLGNAAGLTAAIVGGRGGRGGGGPVMGARAQLDVNQVDVEGVSLLLETGFNVNGRVTIEGQSPSNDSALAGVFVSLQSDPNLPTLAIPAVRPESDGSFSVSGVTPGTYRLLVPGVPRNTYVKSARLAGVDVLNGGFRIDNSPGGPLDIVLGNAPGTVDATVVDDRQMPVPAVTVALIPAAAAQEKRYEIYRSATSDASGKIHLDGVVPGDYKIYAWESVENGAWTDPSFMRTYLNNGAAIRVTEGGRAAADVRVIPYRLN